eukprot:EG_transcript_3146
MAAATWVALALLCASAHAHAPPPPAPVAAGRVALPTPLAATAPRVAANGRWGTALRAQPDAEDLDALTEEERLKEQRRHIQAAQLKDEKKQKQEALEQWREKTGKKRHEEQDRERREKEAKIDEVRARNRKSKEEVKLAAGDISDLPDLIAEEEALALNEKYSQFQQGQQLKDLQNLILEVEAEMQQQKAWQAVLEQEALETEAAEAAAGDLIGLEADERDAQLSEKMQVKRALQDKREKLAKLEAWRVETGKGAQDPKDRQRRQEARLIAKRRTQARDFKQASRVEALPLSEAEAQALEEVEERYSNTEAALELQTLLQRVQDIEQLVEEERQRKEEEVEVILKAAQSRLGVSEEELAKLQEAELERATQEKVKVKAELEARREKQKALDRVRAEKGRTSEELQRARKERQKRLTKMRNRLREGKHALPKLEAPIDEDPYANYLEEEELALARAYAQNQIQIELTSLRDRLGDLKGRIADDRSRSSAVGGLLAKEDELLQLETKQKGATGAAQRQAKRDQDEKRQKLRALDAMREKQGKPVRADVLARRQQQRQLARKRQLVREAKYEAIAEEAELSDAELDELELMVLDEYYAQSVEASAIEEMNRKVEMIEAQLEQSRAWERGVEQALGSQEEEEDDDEGGPGNAAGPGKGRGSSSGTPGASPGSGLPSAAVAVSAGIAVTFLAAVAAVLRVLHRSSAALLPEEPARYYGV